MEASQSILFNSISKEYADALRYVKAETIESIIKGLWQLSQGGQAAIQGEKKTLTDAIYKIGMNTYAHMIFIPLFESLALETRLPEEILALAGHCEVAVRNRGDSTSTGSIFKVLGIGPKNTAIKKVADSPLDQNTIEVIAESIAERVEGVNTIDVKEIIDALQAESTPLPWEKDNSKISHLERAYLIKASVGKDTTPLDISIALISIDERVGKTIRAQAKIHLEKGKRNLQELLSRAKPDGKNGSGNDEGGGNTTPPASESGTPSNSQSGSGNKLGASSKMSDSFGGFFQTTMDTTTLGMEYMLEGEQDPMSIGIDSIIGGNHFFTPLFSPQAVSTGVNAGTAAPH